MPKIASRKEWDIANAILADKKKEQQLASGFKISKKNHKGLKHTFIYFENEKGESKLVCPSRYYYLGHGGEGKVKLAEDESGNLYALKMMIGFNEGREAPILEHLGALIFRGKNDRMTYVLETYQKGLTLNEYVYTCQFTEEQKLAVIYHIAKALQFLHQKNVSHEDIKVNNYLIDVTTDNKVSVTPIDFNLSFLNSDEKMQERKSYETTRFSYMVKQGLGWQEFGHITDNKKNMDEIVAELEKYKDIILPVPDTKKRLIEEYVYARKVLDNKNKPPQPKQVVEFLFYLVRRTNDITELNELFKFIKEYESKNPLLRKEIKENHAWKETLNVFKTRTLQIAEDNINLEIPIVNPEFYYNILAEGYTGRWFFKSSRLDQFEQMLKDHKNFSEDEMERYQRAKLIKYLDKYICRIETYKDSSNEINYRHGFWFDKDKRAVNRKVNYKLAVSLRDKLSDINHSSFSDIFNEDEIQRMRNNYDIKPTRKEIGSRELMNVIHLGEKLGKQGKTLSP